MTSTPSDNNHSPVQTDAFRLGDILVAPAHNTLEARGREVRLQPKVMEVLCYLAFHHQRVVSNDELTREVWQGRVVTHGSVQKSITLLRKAFATIVDDQELVTHYAKRGYQLQIAPCYIASELSQDIRGSRGPQPLHRRLRNPAFMLLPVIAVLAAVIYLYQSRHTWVLTKDHHTVFTALNVLIDAPGFARSIAPHPNNRHLAYIMDTGPLSDRADQSSHLVIRDDSGLEWWIAENSGLWQEIAWSPNGQQLAVLELTQEDGALRTHEYHADSAQLYDIHVFDLDLGNNRVLGKHRLSQWQGQISSLTWWDDDTLELVGRQGEALVRQRYRYALSAQRLETVEAPNHATNPLLTRVHNGLTAMAHVRDNTTRIDFLRPNQSRFARHTLDYRVDDLSWLSDGSGVLANSESKGLLTLLYRDGKRQALSINRDYQSIYAHPNYSADGTRIYMTRIRYNPEIWLQTRSGDKRILSDNGLWRQGAVLSPSGDRLAYVSVRDRQPGIHLMDLRTGEERTLNLQTPVDVIHKLIWADADNLVFRVGPSLYRYSLQNQRTALLWTQARNMEPVAVLQQWETLLVLRLKGDATNLWQLNVSTGEERQLTFGSLGSTLAYHGEVYFQYAGQQGLWIWRSATGQLENMDILLPRNSRIVAVDDAGIYYINSPRCRESAIFYLEFAGGRQIERLSGPGDNWHITSFQPQAGALVSPCGLQQSSLMVME